MIFYCVIDTNVLVSALLKADSLPGIIIQMIKQKEIVPLYNQEIIDEYKDVLFRSKFKINSKDASFLISYIVENGLLIEGIPLNYNFLDYEDEKFYAIYKYLSKFRESYLITGNLKHFPLEENIISPREFYNKINHLN